MKVPKNVFLAKRLDDPNQLSPYWHDTQFLIDEIKYIRKDIVDETIKTAEDHAYFAGKEKMREELLEWAKKMKEQVSIGLNEYDMGEENGKAEMLNKLIEKIQSL